MTFKSLTQLFSCIDGVIVYLNETSTSLESITISKYPSEVGAMTPGLMCSFSNNTGVIVSVISGLFLIS